MNTVKEIEDAILRLSHNDLLILSKWFDKLDAQRWDEQFEEDVTSGKLDRMAKQALADFKSGQCREI